MTDAQVNQEREEVHVTFTTELPVVQQQSSSVSSDLVSKFMNPTPDTCIDSILNPNIQSDIPINVSVSITTTTPFSDTIIPQTPIPIIQPQQQTHDSTTTTTIPATTLTNIPKFASLFVVSSISGIVDNYLMSKMKDEVNVAIQLQLNKLIEEAQAENEEFLNQIESNIKAIIKDQVKAQVKAQVSKILPKVEKFVTESLRAEVLARSSNQPHTSYAAVAYLSKFELKKILIDKIDENKSMNRSDVQKNLYNALIKLYNSNKYLFAFYGDVVTLKRGCDNQEKDEEPFESKSTSSSKGATRSQPKSSGKSAQVEEHGPRVDDLEEPSHQEFNTGNDDVSPTREVTDVDARLWNLPGSQTPNREWNKTKTVDDWPPQSWMTQLAQVSGIQSSFNEFLATLIDFSAFIMNRIKINNLTQDVLTGLTYDLKKGTCKSVVELEYHLEEVFKATHDQLDWHTPEGRLIIVVTSLKIMKFFSYKHLEEIIVRRQDGKLTNLNLEERFTLNVALIMYTRRIVIQECVEDLQLAVESYQKKINLSRPDSYQS
ncbi:hypothetical protein Tco_0891420 [Tanacetum coccineum]|uniref:Uncharacterized protein n=1 Tax=Tanacetum coccineum TaxID=301880 RepID=A0ABQ5C685_9ASTR